MPFSLRTKGLAWIAAACGLLGACAGNRANAPRAPQAASDPSFAEYEAELARERATLEPAVAALRAQDIDALERWTLEPGRSESLRTFGAMLLVQLAAPGSERLFVESFPARDEQELWRLRDLQRVLGEDRDVSADAHHMLVCGALRAWDGAIDKLLEVRPLTDGALHQDNCCGLGLYAAEYPDDAMRRFTEAKIGDEVVHAFEEEASPATAKKLLAHLAGRTYDAPAEEALRNALLPVLNKKANASGPKLCDWMRCSADEPRQDQGQH